jgi:cytochrome c553
MRTERQLAIRFTVAAILLAAAPAARAGDAVFGEYLSAECVTCHQISGDASGGVPAIVGWPEEVFIEALSAYKTGARDNAVMRNIAARLTDDEMAALATYFAAQKQ